VSRKEAGRLAGRQAGKVMDGHACAVLYYHTLYYLDTIIKNHNGMECNTMQWRVTESMIEE
jgi:hypothetical protein